MILSEQQVLELKCRLEKYITEREVMIAHNKQVGQSLVGDWNKDKGDVYSDDDFFQVMKKIEELENHICWLGEK